ncbi:MAG: hypothetical protein Q8O15_11850 [Rectinemataceae bacterium]|nr:hypothetical protein [Rectinemataceae bacterium]
MGKIKWLAILPRIAGIGLILFVGLFSLDVFDTQESLWAQLGGFIIHLLPSLILTLVLFVAWKFELIGAITYMGIALFYYVLTGGREHWSAYAVLSGSLFLVGILFLVSWIFTKEKPKR